MPQIAQQDYLMLSTGDYSPDEIQTHPEFIQEKANELMRRGVLFDAILGNGVDFCRIVSFVVEGDGNELVLSSLSYIYEGEVMTATFDNE